MSEQVNHPSHYGGADSPYEAIKVIEAWGLDFHIGNVVKYISRAGKKSENSELQDLKKAAFYLNRKIALLEEKVVRDVQSQYPLTPEECFPDLPWGEITEVEKCKTCGASLTYEESAFGWECSKCLQKQDTPEQAPYISLSDEFGAPESSPETNL